MIIVLFYVLLCTGWIHKAQGAAGSICPNGCSSHGVCANSSSGGCACYPSFTGVDCSLRVCPSSRAWVDIPTDSLHAHAEFAECSNMVRILYCIIHVPVTYRNYQQSRVNIQGKCDRSTGLCKCRNGFEGAACDKSKFQLMFISVPLF